MHDSCRDKPIEGQCGDCIYETAKQLRAALKPFADVAKGIPDNWPAENHLQVRLLKGECLSYGSVDDEHATLPTIAEWRAAAEAAGAKS